MFVLTPSSQNLMSTSRKKAKSSSELARNVRAISRGDHGSAHNGGGVTAKVQKPPSKKKRRFPPPFTRAVHKLFINALKNPGGQLPSIAVLSGHSFVPVGGKSLRQRFRESLPKFEVKEVDGSLVFGEHKTEEVLISKQSKKIILPVEDIPRAIHRAHVHPSHTARRDPPHSVHEVHASWQKTCGYLCEDFTTTRREFGIDSKIVKRFVENCPLCSTPPGSHDDTDDDRYLNIALRDLKKIFDEKYLSLVVKHNAQSNAPSVQVTKTPTALAKFTATTSTMVKPTVAPLQVPLPEPTKQTKATEPRFASMVAKVPHEKCIWYNRENIAAVDNKFSKLLLVLTDIKGDMALSFKGDDAAKIRLDTKIYVARLLISEYLKCLAHSLKYNDKDIEQVKGQLVSLQKEYSLAGQSTLFRPDLQQIVDKNDINIPELVIAQFRTFLDTLSTKEKIAPKENNMESEPATSDTTKHVLECL